MFSCSMQMIIIIYDDSNDRYYYCNVILINLMITKQRLV